ncbi:MAG: hypothetical protein JW863_05800 [Chitinispirillaceae bacterium]|nr:hypothetical protein [Chitinispirillaceae bacterium]
MSIKTILFLLTACAGIRAELIQISAQGSISEVFESHPSQAISISALETEENAFSAIPQEKAPYSLDFLIDTDRQGFAVVKGVAQSPTKSASSISNQITTSHLLLSITSSGFPSIQDLYLSSAPDMEIQNVRELTSISQNSTNIIVDQFLGKVSSAESEQTLWDYYFLSVYINSSLESLIEGQAMTVMEGYISERLVEETLVPRFTFLTSIDTKIVSITRTARVPEPSTAVLLTVSILFLPAMRIFKARYHRNGSC